MSTNAESRPESRPESITQEIPKPSCKTCGKQKPPVQEESIKSVYWIVSSLCSFILILCIIFLILLKIFYSIIIS